LSGKPDLVLVGPTPKPEKANLYHKDTRTVLHLLNEAAGRNYREVGSNLGFISERLNEPGVTLDGIKAMIKRQCQRWLNTTMAEYLRPETLFNKTKFDSYYAAKDQPITSDARPSQPRNEGLVNGTDTNKATRVLERRRAEEAARKAAQPPVAT
jgi:uncharacterized phage protein (TIGR02220 family)